MDVATAGWGLEAAEKSDRFGYQAEGRLETAHQDWTTLADMETDPEGALKSEDDRTVVRDWIKLTLEWGVDPELNTRVRAFGKRYKL